MTQCNSKCTGERSLRVTVGGCLGRQGRTRAGFRYTNASRRTSYYGGASKQSWSESSTEPHIHVLLCVCACVCVCVCTDTVQVNYIPFLIDPLAQIRTVLK